MGQLIHIGNSAVRLGAATDWGLIADQLIMPHLCRLSCERLVVAGFDCAGRLQHFEDSAGRVDSHAGLLLAIRRALAPASVTTILIAHNHPTGNAMASAMDWQATRQAAALCRLAGATLVDHWIIADNTMVRLFGDDTETVVPAMSIDACQRQKATL